jgi:hypothetical protein
MLFRFDGRLVGANRNGVRLLWASRITTVWLAGLLLAANGLF